MRYRVRALVVSLVAALAVLPAGAASAISAPTLQAKLTREMRHAGGFSGAFVRDLDSQRTLFAAKPDAPRAPASVEKLYTTASALMRFGPDATLPTSVAGRGFLDPDGVWRGDLYLRGGGDPTLGRDDLQRLVARARRGGDPARRRVGPRRRVALRHACAAPSTPAAPTTATSAGCSAR